MIYDADFFMSRHPIARWPALVGGGLLNVAIGTYYAWSVFVPPLEKEFGWTRTQTSLVPTIDMVMLASNFLIAGFLQDRFGPRAIATFGGLMFSAGLFLASYTTSLPMLYLTWGVMVGMGLGFGYLPPISVGSKWFPHQRGLVNGLAVGIFAAGSGIFGPVAGWLIPSIGWRATFQVLAAMFFVFTMVGAYLLKDPPADFVAPRRPGSTAKHVVHHADVRESGLAPEVAAFAITVGAVGSAGGRLLSGWISDHLGRLFTLRAIIVVSMIATPALYLVRQEVALFYVFLFLVYYCYGTQLSVYTALAGDFFGTRYLSTNYGLLLLAWGFAGVLGPQIGSRIRVGTGTYEYAFFGSAGLALFALGLLSIVRPPKPIDEPVTVLVEG